MQLSVSIVNWTTTDLLCRLLVSIKRHAPSCDYEVIVVDNASSDWQRDKVESSLQSVRIVENSENLGYAEANNQAIAESRGKYVLFLNPDTEVTEGALDTLVGFMDDHMEAAACGARLVRPDGSVDKSVRSFPYPLPLAMEYIGLAKLFPKSRFISSYRMRYFSYDTACEVDQPMGSCLILRRQALEEIGNLDTAFPIFFNEVDWLYRAKKAGWQVWFTPDATVLHVGGQGTGKRPRKEMVDESTRSLVRFYKKHFKGAMSPFVYWPAIMLVKLASKFRR